MGKVYFEVYGELEWIEPKDYYAGAWTYVCTAQGDDGEPYDIVRDGMELRYTNI